MEEGIAHAIPFVIQLKGQVSLSIILHKLKKKPIPLGKSAFLLINKNLYY
jgi:hypothetical protein